ncbi:MAG: hypothetical protein CL946_08065 [Ectothiorhodospiraceae bacterium]|nr:hypothetical protein [Ectothiorhodospiraceae bacterium]
MKSRKEQAAYFALLGISIVFAGGIFAAPYLLEQGHHSAAAVARLIYSPVCHQLPERSFAAFGGPVSVCTRCASIYIAFTAGVILYPFLRKLRVFRASPYILLAAAAIPPAVDWALNLTGLVSTGPWMQTATGVWAGAFIGALIVPAWLSIFTPHGDPV